MELLLKMSIDSLLTYSPFLVWDAADEMELNLEWQKNEGSQTSALAQLGYSCVSWRSAQ